MECPCTSHTLSVLIMAPLRGRGGGGVLAYPAPKTPWEQTRDGPHPMWWMRFMNDIPYSIWLPPVAGRDGGWRQDGGQMRELRGQGTNFYLDSPHFLSCSPHSLPPQSPSSSVLLLGSAILRNALGSQFSQHIIQVIGIWVAMASEIRAKLCLVVDLIPDDSV